MFSDVKKQRLRYCYYHVKPTWALSICLHCKIRQGAGARFGYRREPNIRTGRPRDVKTTEMTLWGKCPAWQMLSPDRNRIKSTPCSFSRLSTNYLGVIDNNLRCLSFCSSIPYNITTTSVAQSLQIKDASMSPARISPPPPEDLSNGLTSEQLEFWDKNGYLLIPNALSQETTQGLLSDAFQMLNDFPLEEHPMTKFSTGEKSDHVGDSYFLESGDKVRFFFEEGKTCQFCCLLVSFHYYPFLSSIIVSTLLASLHALPSSSLIPN